MNCDFLIIGGGIVGLSLALEIKKSYHKSKVLVVEKEKSFSLHQTGHNSGVIHSGIYYKQNSLKANNCIRGYNQLINFCKKNNIKYKITGKLIAARNTDEEEILFKLLERGKANGLKNLQILNSKKIKKYESELNVKHALLVPQTGVVDYKEVSKAIIKNFENLGGLVKYNFEVSEIENSYIKSKKGETISFGSNLIIAGGLQSDRLYNKIDSENKLKIIPFRGEYFKLKSKYNFVKGLVYPCPDIRFPFLGLHFTKDIHNNIEIGPNALLSFSREKYKNKFSFHFNDFKESLSFIGLYKLIFANLNFAKQEIKRSLFKNVLTNEINSYFPKIKLNDVVYSRSGIRAQLCTKDGELVDDFMIKSDGKIISVLNAPSPAATSCFSISSHIIKNHL